MGHRTRQSIAAFLVAMASTACVGASYAQLAPPPVAEKTSIPAPDAVKSIIAPSGKLRAGLYMGTPTSILPAGPDGRPRGVGYELGEALAQRLGVPFEAVVFAKNADVLDAIKNARVDVAFTNASAKRALEMNFTTPFLEIELGYLVRNDGAVRDIAAIDTSGTRIGVTAGSSSEGELPRLLKAAKTIAVPTLGDGITQLRTGQLEAYATNKATLFEMAGSVPGARVLDGRWGLERHAIALPKGREDAMSFVSAFASDARSQGLVARAVARAELKGAIIPGD